MSHIVFLDTETTGLDPATEDVFEVAAISGPDEYVYHLRPRLAVVERMHPKAAEVNRYHDRTSAGWVWHDTHAALTELADVLDGAHICGAVPDFDTRFLTETYKRAGLEPPRWHYHLIDIEAMAVGYLAGVREGRKCPHKRVRGIYGDEINAVRGMRSECLQCGKYLPWLPITLPWDSDALSRAIGVEPPSDEERHTALGDACWVKRMYDAITGGSGA